MVVLEYIHLPPTFYSFPLRKDDWMLISRFYIWFFKSNHFNKEKVMCVPPIDSITRNKQTTIHENKKKFQVKYI